MESFRQGHRFFSLQHHELWKVWSLNLAHQKCIDKVLHIFSIFRNLHYLHFFLLGDLRHFVGVDTGSSSRQFNKLCVLFDWNFQVHRYGKHFLNYWTTNILIFLDHQSKNPQWMYDLYQCKRISEKWPGISSNEEEMLSIQLESHDYFFKRNLFNNCGIQHLSFACSQIANSNSLAKKLRIIPKGLLSLVFFHNLVR